MPLISPVETLIASTIERVFVDDEVLAFFAIGIDTILVAAASAANLSSSESESDALCSSDSSDSLEFHFEASK